MSDRAGLNSIGIFCGAGGLDLGLEAAGFSSRFLTDIDDHSIKTILNTQKYCAREKLSFLRDTVIEKRDILELEGDEILRRIGLRKGQVQLLAGGPPCQAFSVFGKRGGTTDPRGRLFYEYARLLHQIEPEAFIFENVSGMLTVGGGEVFKEIVRTLSNPKRGLTYTLSIFDVDAADFGVPQFRRRILIIGSKAGKRIPFLPKICGPLDSIENLLPWRTVSDGLRGIPKPGPRLANHVGRDHSERIIERFRNMKFGERDPLNRTNKLRPDRPSFAIIVGSDKGGGKLHIHPFEAREITPRESARMQTFPDWIEFSGTSRHPIRQIGNAVPPLLAAMVGREIGYHLFGRRRSPVRQVLSKLSLEYLFTGREMLHFGRNERVLLETEVAHSRDLELSAS